MHHLSSVLETVAIAEAAAFGAVAVEVNITFNTALLGSDAEEAWMGEVSTGAVGQECLLCLHILSILLQVPRHHVYVHLIQLAHPTVRL